MRLRVKPHQAFFWAARTDHAAGLLPMSRALPGSLPEHSFAAALPSPQVGGGRRRKNAPRLHPHAAHGARRRWRRPLPSVGVLSGPGARPEQPSIRVGPATVPSTFYRVRRERPARQQQEPTHRTNGALSGSPGGTTAALSDFASSTATAAAPRLCPLIRPLLFFIPAHALPLRRRGRLGVPPRRRADPQTPVLLLGPCWHLPPFDVTP
jgi:hypothetical protein